MVSIDQLSLDVIDEDNIFRVVKRIKENVEKVGFSRQTFNKIQWNQEHINKIAESLSENDYQVKVENISYGINYIDEFEMLANKI